METQHITITLITHITFSTFYKSMISFKKNRFNFQEQEKMSDFLSLYTRYHSKEKLNRKKTPKQQHQIDVRFPTDQILLQTVHDPVCDPVLSRRSVCNLRLYTVTATQVTDKSEVSTQIEIELRYVGLLIIILCKGSSDETCGISHPSS